MTLIKRQDVLIPAMVPDNFRETYIDNYLRATHSTGRLMMFAGDQKIEHLNDDFYGDSSFGPIAKEDRDPEHLFEIAEQGRVGVFAAQLGLISRYGRGYKDINYLLKLNSKSHLVDLEQHEPISQLLWSIEQVLDLKARSGLNIVGVGYTCYLGSEYETQMLAEAADLISKAHSQGLITCIWMYPRGKAISNEKDSHLIAGAAGVAACLGADFVKINFPSGNSSSERADLLKEAVWAAGRTGVICAGGGSIKAEDLLEQLYDQVHISGVKGNATGRNIHQRDLSSAIKLCNAISSILHGNCDLEFATKVYRGEASYNTDELT